MNEMSTTTALGRVEIDGQGIATITMQMAGRANKINEDFLRGLVASLDWALAREGLKGIVLASGHKEFCVGADIDMLYAERDPARILEAVSALSAALRRMETSKKPVVAAITGSALGGGYELCLACHRRVALDEARVQVGLPEVNLGVIPGGGGTQRLPRLTGIQAALETIAQGKVLRASKALDAGLVDELAPDAESVLDRAREWILANPSAAQPWDRDGFSWPPPAPESEMGRNIVMGGAAMLFKKTAGAFPAAEAVLSVVQEGARLAFDRAVEVEARAFARLATSDQAKDMIRTFWFHKNAAERHEGLPSLPEGTDAGIHKVGVLGAGMMGAGLAYVCAERGYEVVLKDIAADPLERGMAHVREQADKRLRYLDAAGRRAVVDRVRGTVENADLAGCDLVIEAVIEDKRVKHVVNREIEPLLAKGAIWASNTSALPITELSESSAHRDRFVGLHFFSPVEVMPLLEIIRGASTSDETVARSLAFCRSIKKIPIVVNDGYGFFTSRVFASYLMEGAQLVVDGHDPVLVEWAARVAGMVVSPLQVFDEVSLRLGRHVLDEAARYTGRVLPGASELVRRMVDAEGRVGRAAGAGFYDYAEPAGKRLGIWAGLRPLADAVRAGPGPALTGVGHLARRLLVAQCAEVARAMDDGVLRADRDAEVGAIFGIGFAPNTGGPLAWMDRQGLPRLVAEMDALAASHGDRYLPARVLREKAARGERFFAA